jgi:Spy/CpxP family protein refolding chaperone
MKRVTLAVLLGLTLAAAASGEGPPGGEDPFARYLFAPDRVMAHAQEIGLDEGQRNAIRNEIQRVQSKFVDTQFDLQSEVEKMTRLLQERPVDEARVLSEVDRVLALEKEIKKTQISLLVRIKNLLTPAQQAKLAQLTKVAGQ